MGNLFHAITFSVLMTAALTACGTGVPDQLTGQAVDAQVLDANTKQPIEGAIVLLRWSSTPKLSVLAFDGHSGGKNICYHAETAVSNALGRYHIEPWSQVPPYKNMPNGDFNAVAYKRGYVQVSDAGSGLATRDDGTDSGPYRRTPTILMKPFIGTLEKRFDVLIGLQTSCSNVEPSNKRNLYPIVKAIYDEMVHTAQTEHQKEISVPNAKTRLESLPSR